MLALAPEGSGWCSPQFIQKRESAEKDGERDPEMNIGGDSSEKVAGGTVSWFGQMATSIGSPESSHILGAKGGGVNASNALKTSA